MTYIGDTYISSELACRYSSSAELPKPTPSLLERGPGWSCCSLCAPAQGRCSGSQALLEPSGSPTHLQRAELPSPGRFFEAQLGFSPEGEKEVF